MSFAQQLKSIAFTLLGILLFIEATYEFSMHKIIWSGSPSPYFESTCSATIGRFSGTCNPYLKLMLSLIGLGYGVFASKVFSDLYGESPDDNTSWEEQNIDNPFTTNSPQNGQFRETINVEAEESQYKNFPRNI